MDLQAAFDKGFDAVKAYVDREFAAYDQRLSTMERTIREAGEREPLPGAKGDPGDDGQPGANASDEQVAAAVAAWLKANPPAAGRDGVDGKDGRDGADGKAGRDGKDGAAAPMVAGAIKDHAGELILTLTDGTVLKTGIVDGAPGADGLNGKDGADGMGFDDFDLSVAEDGRTVIASYERGDLQRTFELGFHVVLDRGVYRPEVQYAKGDGVTWGGSFWIAQCDTKAKPETNADWRLAVKRGRDGKDFSK